MGRQDWVKAPAAWAFDLTTNSYTLVVAKTSYEYDEQGRVTKTTFEGGTYTETGYDSLGRKAWERDQLGRQTDYTYDDAGHLTSVTLPSVSDAGRNQNSHPQYTYGYDAYGNMTSLSPFGSEPQGRRSLHRSSKILSSVIRVIGVFGGRSHPCVLCVLCG